MVIKDLELDQLQQFMVSLRLPGYRANQIFDWIYQKKSYDWDDMTNLPLEIRKRLIAEGVAIEAVTEVNHVTAPDGTIKFLFALADGERVESVYLPEEERHTVCFSTQAGCGMGCIFCATGRNGLIRNLSTAEIVDQIVRIESITKKRISNLVAMGQGEPLANYEALMKAIRIINHPKGLGIGARKITISTCGLVPGILKLANEPLQVNLAISLHAAENELRDRLMPINRTYPIASVMEAVQGYINKSGRRVTIEYTMIAGVNDRMVDARNLIKLLSGMLIHVNLIPFNPVAEVSLHRTPPDRVREFAGCLQQSGIETTIRKERGTTVTAACGQLQNKNMDLL